MKQALADVLFEASWEVCNKVGGIYTVVTSKAGLLKKRYSEYYLIGPYFEGNAKIEFEEVSCKENCYCKDLLKEGIKVYHGKWLIKGEPNAILLDTSQLMQRRNEIKSKLWELYKIDSLMSQWEFDEPTVWAWAVGMLIERMAKDHLNKKIVGHFHEWLAGAGLLYLKYKKSQVKTVFTTHATILGRSIAGDGEDLYSLLPNLDPEKESFKKNIRDKFTLERASAQNADIFTTVSEITAIEAEKMLGRRAEVLVLNGLDMAKFPNFEEAAIKHVESRERIKEFISYYFFPYYQFDLDNNLIIYILGRYEFRNKGIDIFIKALAKLNAILKDNNINKTVTAFFFIPGGHYGIKPEILENKNFYRHIQNFVHRHGHTIQKKIINSIITKGKINPQELISEEFIQDNYKNVLGFKKKGNPPLVTHYIPNEDNDQIISHLRLAGLDNSKDDKVKVIFYPVYLNGVDGLIDLNYYDTIIGCHLGVFPSYYEPWGYTPLESAALGVPAVTTDLSGYGMFINTKSKAIPNSGIYVLTRHNKSEDQVVDDFTSMLLTFTKFDKRERVRNSMNAKDLAGMADWKELVENYIEAHNRAIIGR